MKLFLKLWGLHECKTKKHSNQFWLCFWTRGYCKFTEQTLVSAQLRGSLHNPAIWLLVGSVGWFSRKGPLNKLRFFAVKNFCNLMLISFQMVLVYIFLERFLTPSFRIVTRAIQSQSLNLLLQWQAIKGLWSGVQKLGDTFTSSLLSNSLTNSHTKSVEDGAVAPAVRPRVAKIILWWEW